MEQHGLDYIGSNADLGMRLQIGSTEQLNCMYSECLDGIDAEQEYWNMNFDAALSLMTTFYMPFGRYIFLGMPLG